MDGTPASRQRGSEKLWLAAAYEALTENGVEAVKVMPLAKRLGLTRTGFYWYFKDRVALLEAMIQCWEDKNTGNMLRRTRAYGESIGEAMFNLFDCWLDDDLFDARLDLAIRNWARNDKELMVRLNRADSQRLDAVIEMFTRFGFSRTEAEVRANSVIYTQIGYISMQVAEDRAARIDRMPDYVKVFTGQLPTLSEIQRFKDRHAI